MTARLGLATAEIPTCLYVFESIEEPVEVSRLQTKAGALTSNTLVYHKRMIFIIPLYFVNRIQVGIVDEAVKCTAIGM